MWLRSPGEQFGEEAADAAVDVVSTSAASTSAVDSLVGSSPVMSRFHGERLGGGRVDLLGGLGAGGADRVPAERVVLQQSGGHLRAPGVVDADEQDLGRVGHRVSVGSTLTPVR